jgi:cytochrome c oxidase subunit 3
MSEAFQPLHEPWPDLEHQREAVKFGTWAFLASEALFFGGLLMIYTVYRNLYPEAFAIAARETDIVYGTVNTAVLLTSSLTMAVAERAAADGFRRMALWCLAATALFGAAFLTIKGFEYADDLSKHLVPGAHFPLQPVETQIFWAFYWIATVIHATHLTIGIAVVIVAMIRLWRAGLEVESPRFEGIALYWHLVDIIWVILLPLLYLVGRS